MRLLKNVGCGDLRSRGFTVTITENDHTFQNNHMIDYEALANIHHLLRLKADLLNQLARGPRVVKQSENSLAVLEKKVDELKTQWQNCKKEADQKQLTLKQREARIEQLRSRRNSCDSNKEFQLLNDQIAADLQANGVLADEILEMLDRADKLNSDVQGAKDDVTKGQKDLARVRHEVAERQKSLEGQIADVDRRLKDSERGLNGDFLAEYRRRVASNSEDALASTDGETCGYCHQVISTQTLSELYQRRPVFCKGCGTIMYLVKGRQNPETNP